MISNNTIRKALSSNDDFLAARLIRQQSGSSKGDAAMQNWLAGPEKGKALIEGWMRETATTSVELLRSDLVGSGE